MDDRPARAQALRRPQARRSRSRRQPTWPTAACSTSRRSPRRTIVYKGLLLAPQIANFYSELSDPDVTSALCLVHQRFSTNTFPTWQLAHPFRYVAHNGEINTVSGNVNWMHARQSVLASDCSATICKKLFPIIQPGGSDSAAFDNALELLVQSGRSLPHAMAMLIPEAWDGNPHMNDAQEGVLRIPLLADGAVGRPRGHRLHRRPRHRRHARPQRPAPGALPGHPRRPGGDGVGNRRAAGQAGRREDEGPPAARQDVPGRSGTGPHRFRSGDQGAARRPRSPTPNGWPENQITLDKLRRAAARARLRSRHHHRCASAPSATPTKTCAS